MKNLSDIDSDRHEGSKDTVDFSEAKNIEIEKVKGITTSDLQWIKKEIEAKAAKPTQVIASTSKIVFSKTKITTYSNTSPEKGGKKGANVSKARRNSRHAKQINQRQSLGAASPKPHNLGMIDSILDSTRAKVSKEALSPSNTPDTEKPEVKEQFIAAAREYYDPTITTPEELNSREELTGMINDMLGRDPATYVTLEDYSYWIETNALIDLTENGDLDVRALHHILEEQGSSISRELLEDLIDHFQLVFSSSDFDALNTQLSIDLPGAKEAFLEYVEQEYHSPGYLDVLPIRHASDLTVLKEIRDEDDYDIISTVGIDSPYSLTDYITYLDKKSKNEILSSSTIDADITHLVRKWQQGKIKDLTESTYVSGFSEPAEKVVDSMAPDTKILSMDYDGQHLYQFQSPLTNQANAKTIDFDVVEADGIVTLSDKDNQEARWFPNQNLRLTHSYAVDDPRAMNLCFQQQKCLHHLQDILGLETNNSLSPIQKSALRTWITVIEKLSLEGVESINDLLTSPDFIQSMKLSELVPGHDYEQSPFDGNGLNLEWFVQRWLLGRDEISSATIQHTFTTAEVVQGFTEFEKITHTPDSVISEVDQGELDARFPGEYEIKKVANSSVCYFEERIPRSALRSK